MSGAAKSRTGAPAGASDPYLSGDLVPRLSWCQECRKRVQPAASGDLFEAGRGWLSCPCCGSTVGTYYREDGSGPPASRACR